MKVIAIHNGIKHKVLHFNPKKKIQLDLDQDGIPEYYWEENGEFFFWPKPMREVRLRTIPSESCRLIRSSGTYVRGRFSD